MKQNLAMIGILTDASWGREQATAGVRAWAKDRRIGHVRIPVGQTNDFGLESVAGVYVPIRWDFDCIREIPAHLPLIIDYDSVAFHHGLAADLFQGRRVALRRFIRGGAPCEWADYQVPYVHLPSETPGLPFSDRDVIILDIHEWSPLHLQMAFVSFAAKLDAGYRELVERTGQQIKFYINKMMDFDRFMKMSDLLVQKTVELFPQMEHHYRNSHYSNFMANLLPPIASHAEHRALYARARAFFTDHWDLTDLDVFNAHTAGAHIVYHESQKFFGECRPGFSLREACAHIEPAIRDEANYFLGIEHPTVNDSFDYLLSPPARTPDRRAFTSLYMKSWDALWHWVTAGEKDPIVDSIARS